MMCPGANIARRSDEVPILDETYLPCLILPLLPGIINPPVHRVKF
jgi:hypothetical protein